MSIPSIASLVADVHGSCDVTVNVDGTVRINPTVSRLDFTAEGFYAFLRHLDAASACAIELADKKRAEEEES